MNITKNSIILFGILLFSMVLSLIIHSQTYSLLTSGIFPQVLTPDPWYILRQIDLATHAFPSYAWFDPFTSFPQGATILWGPFLPWLGAISTLIFGAGNESSMILLVSWIPVVISVLTIPLVYQYGKNLQGEFCGISAALLISVIPGSFLIRSMYGYVDHHILESFFMLAYALVLALTFSRIYPDNHNPSPIKPAIYGGLLSGLILGLGMINAPTIIIAAGITTIFFLIAGYQLIIKEKNILPFTIFVALSSLIGAIITLTLHAPEPENLQNTFYDSVSLASVLFIPVLMGIFMGMIQTIITKKQIPLKWTLPTILASGIVLFILAAGIFPTQMNGLIHSALSFTTPITSSYAIGEYLPLSLDVALFNYHLMLLLLIPGLFFLFYAGLCKNNVIALYLFLWTCITGSLTLTNTRFEILFAVPLVLTYAFLLDWLVHYQKKSHNINTQTLPKENTIPKVSWRERPAALIALGILIGTCALSLCISGMIATADYNYQPYVASEDWVEGLLWMKNATPDTGVDYYQVYHSKLFDYPDSAYGVLSWWDYGHWITTVGHRMAVTNPFQANLDIAAQFFMNPEESAADTIATTNDVRYIITDADMLFDTMQMMMPLYSKNATPGQYMGLISTTDPLTGKPASSIGYRQPFYESMVTRLHVFDGSAITGEKRELEEEGTPVPGTDLRVIFPGDPDPEISDSIIKPIKDLDALHHYRLIWESNTSLSTTDEHDIRKVKIYERVPGAVIQGEGTIELPLITNRGRTFTYRQKSVNGTFILPYSTNTTSWPVHATGPYQIVQTMEEREVSEKMVLGE